MLAQIERAVGYLPEKYHENGLPKSEKISEVGIFSGEIQREAESALVKPESTVLDEEIDTTIKHLTAEQKFKISRSKSGVMANTYPFFKRRILPISMSSISGLTVNHLERIRRTLRHADLLEPLSDTQTRLSISKGMAVQIRRKKETILEKKNREKTEELVREFLSAGFISDDLSNWEKLNQLYENHERPLPLDEADQLRLEVFLNAKSKASEGDKSLLMAYQRFGESIDPEWFHASLTGEEEFISEHLVGERKIAEIFVEHGVFMKKTAMKFLHIPEDAEDVVSEAMMYVVKANGFPNDPAGIRSHLHTIVESRAIDKLRSKHIRVSKDVPLDPLKKGHEVGVFSAEREGMGKIKIEELIAHAKKFDRRRQSKNMNVEEIIRGRLGGYSFKEIALSMGVPEATLKTRLRIWKNEYIAEEGDL